MKIGTARVRIDAASKVPGQTVHDSLYARTLVALSVPLGAALSAVEGVVADAPVRGIIASLDLVGLSEKRTTALREALAKRFSAPVSAVVIALTHNHSSPREHEIDPAALLDALVRSVEGALAAAKPARMRFARASVGRDFSRNRRWDSRRDWGTFTIIDNSRCEFREGDPFDHAQGRPESSREGEVYVKGYVENELAALGFKDVNVPDDARLDGPVDEELSLLAFEDGSGRSLGGICRFAAHVDQLAMRDGPVLSAEYPGCLCSKLDRELGGTFLFLNGCSGDIKPYYREYTFEECRRVGEGLAGRALAALGSADPAAPVETVDFYADRIHVTPRQDFPRDLGALVRLFFELRQEHGGGKLARFPIKTAREKDEFRWTVDTMAYEVAALHGGDASSLFRKRWPVTLGAVSFNRQVHYLCLQEEVFSEMTRRLRADFPDLKGLQTVAFANGAEFYLPPDEAIRAGGYEPTWSIYGPGCFDAVHAAAKRLMQRVVSDGRKVRDAEGIASQLRSGGVEEGDVVLVHSAIRDCGYVEGGAAEIIRGILKALGPKGTALFPTFTGARENSPSNPPTFDRAKTPCWTGAMPEEARRFPGAVRSFHPTHSTVAIGAEAEALTADHVNSVTPIDRHSPIFKVAERGGKYLIIGLDLCCLTLSHHVEEIEKFPDPCHAKPCLCLMIDGPRRELREYFLHDWSVRAIDYERYRPLLERAGAIRPLEVGDARAWLLDAAKTYEVLRDSFRELRRTEKKLK